MIKHAEKHPGLDVEGCFGCRIAGIQFGAQSMPTRKTAVADMFKTDVPQAKSCRCKNCAAFIQTSKMLSCIEAGLGDEPGNKAAQIIYKANLGYCEIFDFKCAGERTCDAWVTGGPIKGSK